MAPDSSLPSSQQPATGPYAKPDESSPRSDTLLVYDSFKNAPHLWLYFSSGPSLSSFPYKTLRV
jgi:hypothetical protein